MKRHLRPRCTPFETAQGAMVPHASILRRPCAYYSTRTLFTRYRLQCVNVMNINYISDLLRQSSS